MRRFNTPDVNIKARHYTLGREALVEEGLQLVANESYFTIWAPRQTGKSTYFTLLGEELDRKGYVVAYVNFENQMSTPVSYFLSMFTEKLNKFWQTDLPVDNFSSIFHEIEKIKEKELVLIIDEIEGLNNTYLNEFLHSVRSLYHTRQSHSLKSVILVGVTNITGVIQDNASPFNIADNLDIPFFTKQETEALLGQHEQETGQLFEDRVKASVSEITANQPGLVNGFAHKLVTDFADKPVITYEDYLKVEDWYINKAIDKNVANIVNKANQYRGFVENLLFREEKIRFQIDRPAIKTLYTNGLIESDEAGYVIFRVPLYQKKLFNTFYPYTNGEGSTIAKTMLAVAYLDEDGRINFDKLIDRYKTYINERGFRPYREKDEDGNFVSIPEAAMIYSFETFISIFIQEIEGKSYREAFAALGNTDLIINVKGVEYLIETKKYYSPRRFQKGKQQLAYYCNHRSITEGIYIAFIEAGLQMEGVVEAKETIDGVVIKTYLIRYDIQRDF
ncbi:MAG: AAA-like domain-containing protein [Bacteroidota bacterium]